MNIWDTLALFLIILLSDLEYKDDRSSLNKEYPLSKNNMFFSPASHFKNVYISAYL